MKFAPLLLALGALTQCAAQVAPVPEHEAEPNTIVLKAGQSAILAAGQTAKVPFGSSVLNPGGGGVNLYGHFNTVNTVGGAIVTVPINAPGASDNTVIAASVSLHDPDPDAKPHPAPVPPSSAAAPTPTAQQERETRVRAIMEGTERKLADRTWIPPFVIETYGPVVEGLSVEAAIKTKLLNLLADRKRAVADANQQYWKMVQAAQRLDRTANLHSGKDRDLALQQAASKAEGEIKALVDAEVYARVSAMIMAESELSGISLNEAKAFEEEGCPLNPDQRLSLATAKYEGFNPRINPKAYPREKLAVNHAGLTEVDEEVLKKLDGRLTPQQLLLVRKGLYFSTRSSRGLPTEWEHRCELPADAAKIIGDEAAGNHEKFSRVDVTLRGSGRARLKPAETARSSGDDREFCAVSYDAHPTDKNGSPLLMLWEGVALFDESGHLVKTVDDSAVTWINGRPKAKYPGDGG